MSDEERLGFSQEQEDEEWIEKFRAEERKFYQAQPRGLWLLRGNTGLHGTKQNHIFYHQGISTKVSKKGMSVLNPTLLVPVDEKYNSFEEYLKSDPENAKLLEIDKFLGLLSSKKCNPKVIYFGKLTDELIEKQLQL